MEKHCPKKLTDFSGGKKGRGTEASDKPEEPQYLCTSGPLQNGGSAHPFRPHPSLGLDNKNGLEGCLLSGTNPPAVPTTLFQWNGKVYQFQCLPFGLTSVPRVFSKVMKPVVGTL